MKFEYASKSQEYDASGAASATKVVLKNTDGAIVPVFLPVEKIDLSNTEHVLNEKAAETIAKMEAQMTKQQEQSKTAQLTLINVISKLYEKEVLTDEDLAETSIGEIKDN